MGYEVRIIAALIACLLVSALPATSQSLLVDGSASVTLNFAAAVGATPAAQTTRLTASNAQSVPFQIAAQSQPPAYWLLQPQVSSASTPADITLAVNSQILPAGTYQTVLRVFSTTLGYQEALITVNLTVGPGGGTVGTLVPSATLLTFASNLGSNPAAQNVTISSATITGVSVSTTVNAPSGYNWLSNWSITSYTVGPGASATLTVSPNPAGLGIAAGSYTGSIILTPTSGTATVISVTLSYGVSGATTLTASPSPLVLNAQLGGSTTGQLTVSSIYGTAVSFYASASVQTGLTNWLQVQTSYGTTPQVLNVTASAAGLTAGAYTGTVTLTPTASGQSTQVQVQLNVGGGGTGPLGLYPQTLSFSAPVGGSLQSGTVYIQNYVGSFTATATVTNPVGGSWLTVSPTSGSSTPATLTVTAQPFGLGVGTYTGTITVISQTGLAGSVGVALSVGVTGAYGLTVSPAALAFSAVAGSGQAPAQTILVSSSYGATVQFTATSQVAWLTVSQPNAFTPASITVQANSSLLTAGSYQGSVLISGGGASVSVPVLFVLGTATSTVSVSPASLTLSASHGGPSVSGYSYVSSTGGASAGFGAQVYGASWLSVSSTGASTPATVTITANPYGLSSGVYGGFVLVQPSDGSTPQVIAVTLNVGVSGGIGNTVFTVSPGGLSFSASQGGAAPAGQVVTITSLTGLSLNFTTAVTTQSGNWLLADPASGYASLSSPVVISVNPTGLSAGTYQGAVNITATVQGVTASIPIVLTVTGPAVTVTPLSLSFTAASGGPAPAAQSISVTSAGAAVSFTATASATTGANWLSVSPTTGSTTATLTVSVNQGSLAPGAYNGQVRITQAGSTTSYGVDVTLTVTEAFTISLSANQVSLNARAGDPAAATRTITVIASSGNRAFTVAASGGNWLAATPDSGNTPADVTIRANASGLAAGTHNGTITVAVAGASNSPQGVNVVFTVNPRGPAVSAIVHGAAMAPAYFTAGGIFTIFGENLGPQTAAMLQVGPNNIVTNTLGGVRVLVDGIPAPMLYAQARQINGVIPFGVAGRAGAEVIVEYQGERSTPQQIPLSEAAPGVFTLDGSGRGPGAILNHNNTVNSVANPAPKGSVISVYLTGVGQTTPPGIDGLVPSDLLPVPLLPPTARVGDQDMEVLYAGAAPGLVSGAIQVNIRIAPDARSGVQALIVRFGRFSSQFGATVAIQ
ncbi:MAG: hypothetical protein AAB225_22380 [Acidobacteriota bacterium]